LLTGEPQLLDQPVIQASADRRYEAAASRVQPATVLFGVQF
jgi:hypothetical protein